MKSIQPLQALIVIAAVLHAAQPAHAMYHPVLGRFGQRDPIGYVDGGNLYGYVVSRPQGSLDPYGTDSFGEPVIEPGDLPGSENINIQQRNDKGQLVKVLRFRRVKDCTVAVYFGHTKTFQGRPFIGHSGCHGSASAVVSCFADKFNTYPGDGPKQCAIKDFPRITAPVGDGDYSIWGGVLTTVVADDPAYGFNNVAGNYNGGFGVGPDAFKSLMEAVRDAAMNQARELAKDCSCCGCKRITLVFHAIGNDAKKAMRRSGFNPSDTKVFPCGKKEP